MTCPEGLVYDECRSKLDDFCSGGFEVLFKEPLYTVLNPKCFPSHGFPSLLSPGCTESNILELPWRTTVQAAFAPLARSGQEITPTSACLTAPVSNAVVFDRLALLHPNCVLSLMMSLLGFCYQFAKDLSVNPNW